MSRYLIRFRDMIRYYAFHLRILLTKSISTYPNFEPVLPLLRYSQGGSRCYAIASSHQKEATFSNIHCFFNNFNRGRLPQDHHLGTSYHKFEVLTRNIDNLCIINRGYKEKYIWTKNFLAVLRPNLFCPSIIYIVILYLLLDCYSLVLQIEPLRRNILITKGLACRYNIIVKDD